MRDALVQLAQRMPLPELGFVLTAMMLQRETGGNLVEVLDRTAVVIRDRLRIQGEIRIYTAQGRLTGWILSFLPVVLGIALYLVNPDGMSLLWRRELGRELLYGAGVMTLIGAFFIRKIVNMQV